MSTFQLAWNEFNSCTSSTFQDLFTDTEFTDVTLATDDDKQLKAHKVILSSCSPFFRRVLLKNPHQHPLLFLKGVKFAQLKSILQFIYLGQAEVNQIDLQSFMDSAKDLEIKGLTDTETSNEEKSDQSTISSIASEQFKNELDYSQSKDPVGKLESKEYSEDPSGNIVTFDQLEQQPHDGVFQCHPCSYQSRQKAHLRIHMELVHQQKKYPCDQCTYQATQDSNLKRHKRRTHL